MGPKLKWLTFHFDEMALIFERFWPMTSSSSKYCEISTSISKSMAQLINPKYPNKATLRSSKYLYPGRWPRLPGKTRGHFFISMCMGVISITTAKIKYIEQATRGKSNNKYWLKERTKCLHSSNFREISTSTDGLISQSSSPPENINWVEFNVPWAN